MSKILTGITGKIESVPVAKMVIRIGAGATIFLALGAIILDGTYGNFATVLLALLMFFFTSRIAAILLFVWQCMVTFFGCAVLFFPPAKFYHLYIPILGLLVFWLQYRAIRATIFIKMVDSEMDVKTIQELFE